MAKHEEILKFVPSHATLSQSLDQTAHSVLTESVPTSAERIFTTDGDPSDALPQYLAEAPKQQWKLASISCSQSLGTSVITFYKTVPDYTLKLEVRVERWERDVARATVFPTPGMIAPKYQPIPAGVLRTDPECLTKAPAAPDIGQPDPRWPATRVCRSIARVWPDADVATNTGGDLCIVTFRHGTSIVVHALTRSRASALADRVSTAGSGAYFATGASPQTGGATGFWVTAGGTELVGRASQPYSLPESQLLSYAHDLQLRFRPGV